MKKLLSIILTMITALSVATIALIPASAASWPSTNNIKTYVISTGNDTTVYQSSSSTSKYGTIYASDLITILGYSGSRLKVSYPTSKGNKIGYIEKSRVTSGTINYASSKWTATSSMTAYRRCSGDSKIGSVSKNDICYSVATSGSRTQIIYPISGGYKMGWVATSSIPKNNEPAPTSSTWQLPMKNAYCTWTTKTDMSWSGYNYSSSRPSRPDHLGLDIYGTSGKVYSATDGKVVAVSTSNSGANGRYVIIEHTINGKKVYSFYAHLSSVLVSKNMHVTKNSQIAVAGGSGYGKNNAYGTHLHFAIVDTLWSKGNYYGYADSFTGNKKTYQGVTYYNPIYIINNNRLP